jgi:hypothetical protein
MACGKSVYIFFHVDLIDRYAVPWYNSEDSFTTLVYAKANISAKKTYPQEDSRFSQTNADPNGSARP